jgi:hypothetical protein
MCLPDHKIKAKDVWNVNALVYTTIKSAFYDIRQGDKASICSLLYGYNSSKWKKKKITFI